jgi:GPH family glycoside/pentoside/hexuronide:cation symporter
MEGEKPRLPLLNKLLYTSDMVGSQAIAQTRNLWLLFFLAPPKDEVEHQALVPALDTGIGIWNWEGSIDPRVLAGIILTAGRIIEAFDDPIIGFWSDRTRTRWGRRIPFIFLSTPFYGLFFSLLWMLPTDDASWANAIYAFVVLELFFLASTFSGQPYEALLPEIATTHRDRVSVVGWQFYFGILGAALGFGLSGVIKDAIGFTVMGGVIAVFGVLFRYLGVRGIWRLARTEVPPARVSMWSAFKATVTNRQFLYFLPSFVFFQLAVGMTIAWLPFFVEQVLEKEETGRFTAYLTFMALAGMVVSVFVLWRLCNALGKRWVYLGCLLGSAVYFPFLFFTGFIPGMPKEAQALFMAFLAGIPMAGVNLLPRAITADITDYDALRTGMRREATYYAMQNLFEKVGSSFSALFVALVLLAGETTDDPLGIRLMGPVAGGIAFIGFWVFRSYRLPDTVTAESVAALERR